MGQETKQGFDLTVTHRDPRTGLITHSTPYTMRAVKGADGGVRKLFERPAGSGNLWDRQGRAIGRWVKGKFVEGEAHIAVVAPESQEQKTARAMNEKDARIAELERELQSVKIETKKKQGS